MTTSAAFPTPQAVKARTGCAAITLGEKWTTLCDPATTMSQNAQAPAQMIKQDAPWAPLVQKVRQRSVVVGSGSRMTFIHAASLINSVGSPSISRLTPSL